MYAEFLIIYIGMGVLALLLAAVIVLQCLLLRRMDSGVNAPKSSMPGTYAKSGTPHSVGGVVFCSNCATQYDSAHRVCPKCGKAR